MLNFATIMSQPIVRPRTSSVSSVERSKIIDKKVLEALHPDKALSSQELRDVTGSSNTGVDSSVCRLIAAGKVERIKNPDRAYGKPSYLFRLV